MGTNERKERERQRRREEILAAAESVFFTKGIENSTMDDVAEKAELSKGTLYLYFKSKEEIHWEITQRHIRTVVDTMKLAMNPEKSAIENLISMAEIFIEHFEEDHAAAHSVFFFQASNLKSLNLDINSIHRAFIEDSPIHMVTEYVKKGIDEGSLRDDIPAEILSSTLWAQLIGVLQIITVKKELFEFLGVNPDAIVKSHIGIVLNGILKNEKN